MAQPDRIILIGLSGSGKSTLAHRIAGRIDWTAVDLDSMIVREAGMSITDIFNQLGEPAFRDLERKALLEALDCKDAIIATGGGAILDPDNRRDILAAGVTVYVKSTPQKCAYYLERSRNKQKRPLLSGDGDIELLLTEQLADRAPFYEIAHLTLDAANKELHDLVDELELISYGPATTDRSY